MASHKVSGARCGGWGRRMLLAAAIVVGVVASASAPRTAPVAASEPWTANSEGVAVHDRWMAEMAADIGRLRLGELILTGSHDSATYGLMRQSNLAAPYYAINQDIDIYAQLQHGIRVLDIRGKYYSWGEMTATGISSNRDYFIHHGDYVSDLALSTVLDDIRRWVAAPGHEKEIVILQVDAARSENPARFDEMCAGFMRGFAGGLLTAATFGNLGNDLGNDDLARYTVDEVWNLPGKQRVIVKWDDCVGGWPDDTWNSYWANQCYAASYLAAPVRPGIINALAGALDIRGTWTDADGADGGIGAIPMAPSRFVPDRFRREVPHGFYTLGVHATITPDCLFPLEWFLNEQASVLDWVKGWFDNDEYHARAHLNIISADFVQKSKVVEYAIAMNRPAQD